MNFGHIVDIQCEQSWHFTAGGVATYYVKSKQIILGVGRRKIRLPILGKHYNLKDFAVFFY